MTSNTFKCAGLLALSLAVAGCASGPGGGSIYVPAGGQSSPDEAPQPPQTSEPRDEPRVERKSEQPDQPVRQPKMAWGEDTNSAAQKHTQSHVVQPVKQHGNIPLVGSIESEVASAM